MQRDGAIQAGFSASVNLGIAKASGTGAWRATRSGRVVVGEPYTHPEFAGYSRSIITAFPTVKEEALNRGKR